MSRLQLAFRSFFSLVSSGALPPDIVKALGLKKDIPAPPAPTAVDGALQLLGLLQRDARLVDFIMEDISGYSDDQVGAAVRQLHGGCRETLQRYTALSPIIDGVEGTPAKAADAGTLSEDPSAVKFLGNVPASGRAKGGVLRHKGWKAGKVALPPLGKSGVTIIAPAEIEVE